MIKEAHRDMKAKYDQMQEQHTVLKEKHAEQERELKEYKERNDELKAENAKLYDNILILQQKITDELGAQMQNDNPFLNGESQSESRKPMSLKDVSLVPDMKKTQGQGGGKTKKNADAKAGINMTDEELRLQEAQEEDELREQMEASNKIAMALVQQENESKQFKDSLAEKEEELKALQEKLSKAAADYVAKEKEMNHYKQLYEDSYE